MTVVEFGAGQGGRVYVEVADQDDGDRLVRAGAGDRVVRAAAQTWNGALSGIRAAAEGVAAQVGALEPAPEEVEVTFGVAVSGKLGATLVSTGSDAHVNVRIVWRNPTADPAGTAQTSTTARPADAAGTAEAAAGAARPADAAGTAKSAGAAGAVGPFA
ncbi:CU044_2847 family protein [Nonomuraea rubra]|uniref:CU044_2847 family protein n=1 Tax=Nonomuraea rubra TaxID=46180 RepID=UPI003401B795